MLYQSTRQGTEKLDFEQVLLKGLADDGGLYVPTTLPMFNTEALEKMKSLSYNELAFEVMYPFVASSLSETTFKSLIEKAYASFNHPATAPLVQIGQREWVLELFHGPTLAFKDFALQLLGQLLNYFLDKRGERGVVMGATSGDTGSAAIEACVACDRLDIFILHPHNRVSEVQRRQMTSVISDNVNNIALEGNFDDCQQMVKASFADQGFLPSGTSLIAVNSINWARIMAQIVYYFSSALQLGAPSREISFSVPTGNFGDIYAGYLAKNMGLPIKQLIVATNENSILHRAISDNDYSKSLLHTTYSPSMDIMVSSNFERLMFTALGGDGLKMGALMADFEQSGQLSLPEDAYQYIRQHFNSSTVNDEQTLSMIRRLLDETGYLADPHTAIGIKASRDCRLSENEVIVSLATAHPAKFSDAIVAAGEQSPAKLPRHLADLMTREERFNVLANDLNGVQRWMAEQLE